MSKVRPKPTEKYVESTYLDVNDFVRNYGISALSEAPPDEQFRYTSYATQANKITEATLYKYLDKLPLDLTDEARIYAEALALNYAKWTKAVDDGANNATGLKELWEQSRDSLIETLKAIPKLATTRSLVSDGYKLGIPPYSQTGPGFVDIL